MSRIPAEYVPADITRALDAIAKSGYPHGDLLARQVPDLRRKHVYVHNKPEGYLPAFLERSADAFRNAMRCLAGAAGPRGEDPHADDDTDDTTTLMSMAMTRIPPCPLAHGAVKATLKECRFIEVPTA